MAHDIRASTPPVAPSAKPAFPTSPVEATLLDQAEAWVLKAERVEAVSRGRTKLARTRRELAASHRELAAALVRTSAGPDRTLSARAARLARRVVSR